MQRTEHDNWFLVWMERGDLMAIQSTTSGEKDTSVLIVGAGPTGLMMACQLTRFGIPYRIIEKNSGPTTQSRALAIQARSLEALAQMNIAHKAVEQGKRA